MKKVILSVLFAACVLPFPLALANESEAAKGGDKALPTPAPLNAAAFAAAGKKPPVVESPVPIRLPSAEAVKPTPVPSEPAKKTVTSVQSNMPISAPAPVAVESRGTSEEIEKFKSVVKDSKKQIIQSDKREFVELSRNYLNRISCAGQLEKLIVPQDQGLEAEITNDNHDLFLRVGPNSAKQFPVDMSLICDGHVFLLNAVVHPSVPSQEIVLSLPKGMRPLSAVAKEKYKGVIAEAEALPLEEKISRIVQRVYKGNLLPYWQEIDTPTSQSRWTRGSYSVLLQKVIKTEIDSLVAWDFVFRGRFPKSAIYDEIRKVVHGDIVSFGIVPYEGHDAARVMVMTREVAGISKKEMP